MTWTWEIDGLNSTDQTLRVYDPDGMEVGSVTKESFTWSGSYPQEVPNLMPETLSALMALQRNDIERRTSG